MNLPEEHAGRLISGEARLTQELAAHPEAVLGVPVAFRVRLEAGYRKSGT